ncbi:MAG: BMP family ABC transporter substrate-binding protein [Clostridia bacterium]|nr:BMP family ABC transporter substrate-binding protein [Clostridia bacterium]MBR2407222.1 BMP family ABC transporter substrate-binding protein [Clostridia bacterium]
MKKILALLLALVMILGMTACGAQNNDGADKMKVGFIFLHDENSTYDKNFITAAVEACNEMGVTMVQKTQIPESNECYEAAKELIEVEDCDIIFADSFGHESFLMKAAQEYPDVQFCHATGTQAHTAGLANFHNAFASIYEGRYMAGVVAGLKLKEMMDADKTIVPKMGYVGAFTFAEVISGYTSFYLGAKSIVPEVTMDVKFTGSWYDEEKEKQAAQALIDGGCVLISQHADSMGAPTACENAKVPNVSYNGSTAAACPETFLVSSRINWVPYFKYMITQVKNGEAIATDWTGTIETGSVMLTELGKNVAAGTADKLAAVEAGLKDGSINVFDTANWTKDGKKLTSYMADVDFDTDYAKDTEAIENGVFYESKHRSGPYFDIEIDGITLLDRNYG